MGRTGLIGGEWHGRYSWGATVRLGLVRVRPFMLSGHEVLALADGMIPSSAPDRGEKDPIFNSLTCTQRLVQKQAGPAGRVSL